MARSEAMARAALAAADITTGGDATLAAAVALVHAREDEVRPAEHRAARFALAKALLHDGEAGFMDEADSLAAAVDAAIAALPTAADRWARHEDAARYGGHA